MTNPIHALLFLGKKDDANCAQALEYCRRNFSETVAHLAAWGDPIPESLQDWQGDYIVSYLSRWIIPEWLISRARVAAINFHPASPDYPGIGCNNFALYEGAKEYGATCHYMATKVDTGRIIAVKRFPVHPNDDVASLLSRTYTYQLVLFYEIMDGVLQGKSLPLSDEKWTRKPFTRKQFNELNRITPEMSPEEVAKRVRATLYKAWRPTVEIGGFTFKLDIPTVE